MHDDLTYVTPPTSPDRCTIPPACPQAAAQQALPIAHKHGMTRPISRYIHHLATALLPGLSLADSVSWLDLLCTVGQQDADVTYKLVSRCKELVCKNSDGKKEVQALAGMLTFKSDGPTGRALQPLAATKLLGVTLHAIAGQGHEGDRYKCSNCGNLFTTHSFIIIHSGLFRHLERNLPRLSPVTSHKAWVETERLWLLGMQTSTRRAYCCLTTQAHRGPCFYV